MKKFFLLVVIFFFIFVLSSCGLTNVVEKRRGQVIHYQVFDLDGNEIIGQYMDEYCMIHNCGYETSSALLNSPAPEDLYYVVDVIPNRDYIITITVKSTMNYHVKKLDTSYGYYEIEDFYQVIKDDKHQYISIRLENINDETKIFKLSNIYMYNPTDDSKDLIRGTTWQYHRTYYVFAS